MRKFRTTLDIFKHNWREKQMSIINQVTNGVRIYMHLLNTHFLDPGTLSLSCQSAVQFSDTSFYRRVFWRIPLYLAQNVVGFYLSSLWYWRYFRHTFCIFHMKKAFAELHWLGTKLRSLQGFVAWCKFDSFLICNVGWNVRAHTEICLAFSNLKYALSSWYPAIDHRQSSQSGI